MGARGPQAFRVRGRVSVPQGGGGEGQEQPRGEGEPGQHGRTGAGSLRTAQGRPVEMLERRQGGGRSLKGSSGHAKVLRAPGRQRAPPGAPR